MNKLILFVCVDVKNCDNPDYARYQLDNFRERMAKIAKELGLEIHQPSKADWDAMQPYPKSYVVVKDN